MYFTRLTCYFEGFNKKWSKLHITVLPAGDSLVDATYATVKWRLASPDKRSTMGGGWTVHCSVECNLAGRAIEVCVACCKAQVVAEKSPSYGSRQFVTAIKRERCWILSSASNTLIYSIRAVAISVRAMSHHTPIYICVTEMISPLQVFYIKYSINICKIWGFHGGDYEECRLLGCGPV
jgi:hypothetical protein